LFIIGGKTAVYSTDNNNWALSSGDFQSVLVYDTVTHQGISMATIGDIPPARYRFVFLFFFFFFLKSFDMLKYNLL
jgi:hypothetical protein